MFQNLLHTITAFITVVIVTMSTLPGAILHVNKPVDSSTATSSATISESPLPATSPATKSSQGEKQVPKKTPSLSVTPNPSPQKINPVIQENRTTETRNLASTPTPVLTTTTLNTPSPNNSAPANETIYSDYNFGYTFAYSPDEPGNAHKNLQFTVTSRDIRVTRAIFRISNEDAEKHDLVDHRYFPTTLLFHSEGRGSRYYPLERVDKNTFLYVGSRTGGLQMGSGQKIYLDISTPTPIPFSGGSAQDISLPMSEWEIWDNSTGKLVKTQ